MKAVKTEEKKQKSKKLENRQNSTYNENNQTAQLDLFSSDGNSILKEKTIDKTVRPNKFEKRMIKKKRQDALLNMRGIPKYYTTYLVELLYIFIVEMLVKILFGNFAFDWTLLRILLSSGLLALFITLISDHMPPKLRRGVLIGFNFIIVFYAWIQLGLMNFVGAFMSIGNAEQGTKIGEYVLEFLSAYEPLLHTMYIPFILTILYLVFERKITRDGFEKKFDFKNILRDVALFVYVLLLVFGYYATLELDFMQNKFQTISNKELFRYPSNPSTSIKNFGTTVYFILDIKNTIVGGTHEPGDTVSSGEGTDEPVTDYSRNIDDTAWEQLLETESDPSYITLSNYFINKRITPKNDYTGMFEGKNLIMIMLESVGSAVFREEYKEYFPTLYKLYTEGITGINNYSPRNNCATGESEMTSQISIYSIETTCTVNTYKNNKYQQALLSMLKKNGYETSSYHDYTDMYYSRSIFEYNMGSSKYYGVTDLGIRYSLPYKEWPSDLEFFQKAIPKFIDQEKFASYMISVTAHTPYIFSSEMGDKHLSLFEDLDLPIQTKRYLSKVKEDDLALEYLLNSLEEKGILEDTVLVLFGDHYPYGLSDKQYQGLANYDISVDHEVDRTPFIIYNSGTDPDIIEKYTTPLDYTPTILNLFGVDYDPRYYFGHDIFSEYTDYAVFPDNSWQSSKGYYSSPKGEFTPAEGTEGYTDEEIIAINKEISDMKNMSSLTIKKNYFNYLFKYFDEYESSKEEEDQEEQDKTEKLEED